MSRSLVTGFTISATGPVAASDGQMLCSGTNIFSDVYVYNGKASAAVCKPRPIARPT